MIHTERLLVLMGIIRSSCGSIKWNTITGNYVGELPKDMIVYKYLENYGNIRNHGNRDAVNYGYLDAFNKLI